MEKGRKPGMPCPPAPFLCRATPVPVPLSSARLPLPGFVSAPTRGGAAGSCPRSVRPGSVASGVVVARPGVALAGGDWRPDAPAADPA